MSREELLERIRKGEKYLERTDITDDQREVAGERYCNLVALLGTMPDEPEKTQETPSDVQECINKIWRTLDPEGKRRRRA